MDFKYSANKISFKKNLNELDEFTIDFCKHLKDINYTLLSGYVAILFGRSRSSEDIDVVIEKLDKPSFFSLWSDLQHKFECLNTHKKEEAFEYLKEGLALRFSYKNLFIPNMELKFAKNLELEALKNKTLVEINSHKIYISPIELQISYKLFLGSQKDIEDARFLYLVFKDYLNKESLIKYNKLLEVDSKWLK